LSLRWSLPTGDTTATDSNGLVTVESTDSGIAQNPREQFLFPIVAGDLDDVADVTWPSKCGKQQEGLDPETASVERLRQRFPSALEPMEAN
jgi:hypothetical protein